MTAPAAKKKMKMCPFCQCEIEAGAVTVECNICKIPHHNDCWQENGRCTTYGCNGSAVRAFPSHGAVRRAPVNVDVNLAMPPPPPPPNYSAPPPYFPPNSAVPPPPPVPVWYVGNDSDGPFTAVDVLNALQENRISTNTPVWREGMQDWIPLSQSELLRSPLPPPPSVGGGMPNYPYMPHHGGRIVEPSVALILAIVFAGAGHFYIGRVERGIAFLCGALLGAFLYFIPGFVIYIWSVVDAYNIAQTMHGPRPPYYGGGYR